MNKDNDWFFNILRLMVEKHYALTDLGLVKIERMKSNDNRFNFCVSVNKGLFEDLLNEDEKAMLWANEEYLKWKEGKINNEL